jgi:hypothetical protein
MKSRATLLKFNAPTKSQTNVQLWAKSERFAASWRSELPLLGVIHRDIM